MQALIFGLIAPAAPLLVRRLYKKEETLTALQAIGRYVAYALLSSLLTAMVMTVMCDEGVSVLEKLDRSPVFALKYIFLMSASAGLIAAAEWIYETGKIRVEVAWEGYRDWLPVRLFRKVLCPIGLYALAALVIVLNFGLMFDNVVWGDEAYSCNAIRNGLEGIFQILTLEENHPPLHYLWLKAFAELFGYRIPVYHFASFVPFCIGVIGAVTLLRRRYGNIPAAFFVMISGLAAPCLEYNMEIRMYALAFLGMAGGYYCVTRILSGSRAAGWIGMVFWASVAAYSHYYALVAAGIMMFVASAAASLRYGGRVWIKGLLSMAAFLAIYAPWLSQLFRATESVSHRWWMTEIEGIGSSIQMIGCGAGMSRIVLALLLLMAVVLFLTESSILRLEKREDRLFLHVDVPSIQKWSDETFAFAVGLLTIAGTVLFAYGLSVMMRPLVTGRYLYPLCAVTAIMLAIGSKRMLAVLKGMETRFHREWFAAAGKWALVLALAVLFVRGNYAAYKATVEEEDARTEEVLYYIGEPDEDTQFVSNGIMHIGWTVLSYYFPDAEVINGNYGSATSDDVWYFTPSLLNADEIQAIVDMGYQITANYGEQQLGKYPFVLYHMERLASESAGEPSDSPE